MASSIDPLNTDTPPCVDPRPLTSQDPGPRVQGEGDGHGGAGVHAEEHEALPRAQQEEEALLGGHPQRGARGPVGGEGGKDQRARQRREEVALVQQQQQPRQQCPVRERQLALGLDAAPFGAWANSKFDLA